MMDSWWKLPSLMLAVAWGAAAVFVAADIVFYEGEADDLLGLAAFGVLMLIAAGLGVLAGWIHSRTV